MVTSTETLEEGADVIVPLALRAQGRYAYTPSTATYLRVIPDKERDWDISLYDTEQKSWSKHPNSQAKQLNVLFYVDPEDPNKPDNTNDIDLFTSLQCAVFVVRIINHKDNKHHWRFHADGLSYQDNIESLNCRITTKVEEKGQLLIITVDQVKVPAGQVGMSAFTSLPFRYLAICLSKKDLGSGTMPIYYSQDPSIGIGATSGSPP